MTKGEKEILPLFLPDGLNKIQQENKPYGEGDDGGIDFAQHAETDGKGNKNQIFQGLFPDPA